MTFGRFRIFFRGFHGNIYNSFSIIINTITATTALSIRRTFSVCHINNCLSLWTFCLSEVCFSHCLAVWWPSFTNCMSETPYSRLGSERFNSSSWRFYTVSVMSVYLSSSSIQVTSEFLDEITKNIFLIYSGLLSRHFGYLEVHSVLTTRLSSTILIQLYLKRNLYLDFFCFGEEISWHVTVVSSWFRYET